METTVTALEMRKKFGNILDRVAVKREHITILRDGKALAALIPADEHAERCGAGSRLQSIEDALQELEAWRKKLQARKPEGKARSKRKKNLGAVEIVRRMRDSR